MPALSAHITLNQPDEVEEAAAHDQFAVGATTHQTDAGYSDPSVYMAPEHNSVSAGNSQWT